MNALVSPTVDWLASTGAPNALVVLALLTKPATWSARAVALADEYLPGRASTSEGSQ